MYLIQKNFSQNLFYFKLILSLFKRNIFSKYIDIKILMYKIIVGKLLTNRSNPILPKQIHRSSLLKSPPIKKPLNFQNFPIKHCSSSLHRCKAAKFVGLKRPLHFVRRFRINYRRTYTISVNAVILDITQLFRWWNFSLWSGRAKSHAISHWTIAKIIELLT